MKRLMQAWLALALAVGVACGGNEAAPVPEAKQTIAGPTAEPRETRRSALESDGGTSGSTPDAGSSSATPDGGGSSSTPDAGSADAGQVEPAPVLTVDAPELGAVLGAGVLVRGRVEGGAAPVKVQVRGVEVPLVAGAFSTTLTLTAETAHTVDVRVTDARGRTDSEQRTVTVDTTQPHLQVTAPAASPVQVSESPYRVEGVVGDTHLAGVSVQGVPVPVVAGGFSAAVPLGEGDNTVVVVAWDAAGNQKRVERVLQVAGLPPQVAIVSPLNGSESPGPVVKVRARVTSTASLASVKVGTGTATLLPSGEYEASVMLALGENTVKVVATDSAGLVGTASVRVRYRDVTTEALTVTGMDPLPGAVGVEPDSLISVAFNKPVLRESLKNHFTVSAGGEQLEGGYSLAPGGQTATFVAKKALPEGTRLTVEVDGVLPEQGPAMAADYTGDFTVRGPLTRVRGYITDGEQQPLAGVGVTLEGRGLTTRTGPDGNWAFFVPEGGEVVVRYEGGVGSDGRPYPKLRRRLFITQGEETVDAPLVLTATDTSSAQAVKVTGAVSLNFGRRHPGLLVQAPADALSFEDGKTTEFVTATWLPSHALPVPMEGRAALGGLWQVGPSGMRVSAPVTLSLPNLTAGTPVGRYALLLAYDPHRHVLARVGFGRVAGAQGEVIVTEEPLRLESLEFLAYMPLTPEQHEVVARALGTSGVGTDGGTPTDAGTPTDGGLGWMPRELRSPKQPWWKLALSPFMVGEAHAQALMGLFTPAVSALDTHIQNSVPGSVTGTVRAPMDRELGFSLQRPQTAQFDKEVRVTLPYELPVEFAVASTNTAWGSAATELVQAKLEVRGPDGVVRAPPVGEQWAMEVPALAAVSAKVLLTQPGQTLLKLMGTSPSGTRVLEVKAELTPDTDGGTGATLKLTKGVDTTAEDEALRGPIRFKGLRVTVTGPAAGGVGMTGDKGGYGIPVMVPGGEEMGISCTEVPLGPKVVERTGEDGVTHYDTVMQQFGVCSPTYSVSAGRNTQADILVDARFLYGNLLFVDRSGKPLDGLCGAPQSTPSERDPDKLGEYLSIAPEDVDSTEVHFFREDDLEHPIATYAHGRRDPAYCHGEQNPVDGGTPAAHGTFSRMRLGPTHGIKRYARARCQELDRAGQKTQEDRDYYQANCQDNRGNFLSLSAGDRLVVFAINHATGYAGMKTVTVPSINRSTRTEEGRCEADEGAPPLSVDEHGQNYTLSRCTKQELGIPVGDIQMYPPEIDVRVTRTMETEGSPKVKLESLVRHGGAATTRDEFMYVSTHWRVRVKPYGQGVDGGTDGGAPGAGGTNGGMAGAGGCRLLDGGSSPDGGSCYPNVLVDEGDAGLPLEVYCTELTADAGAVEREHCIHRDPPLVEVPQGVPPLAGRIVGVTGSAVEEPVVIRFPLKPGGRFVESVQTALRYQKPSGEVETISALPRANYYLHTVGHAIYPRDVNRDGFIQTEEQRIAPPGFSEEEAPTAGTEGGRVPTHAVGLKNVYRHIEADGEKRERFDLALEHAFRVIELKDVDIIAKGGPQNGDLKNETPPRATEDDVAYDFLAHLLEPGVQGRPGNVSDEYVLRLGGDRFGIDCPIQINEETNLLTASCGGEYLPEVLSANDILYLELYLKGNAENVLYRFNFEGLASRADFLSAGHLYTVDEAEKPDDGSGSAALGREISEPPVANFFISPAVLKTGVISLYAKNKDGSRELLKEATLTFANDTWQVSEKMLGDKPAGRARAKLRHDAQPSKSGAWRFQLPLPADLAAMEEGTKEQPSILLVLEAATPQPMKRERDLGKSKGTFTGVNARARAQDTVAGVNVADGHLSFSHTDFSVPQGTGNVSFSRTYNNQNNLVTPMGLGWTHNHDGWVLEEEYQHRYVVVVGGQAYPFPKCEAESRPSTKATCSPDKSHNNILVVDAPLPDPTVPEASQPKPFIEMRTQEGWTYRFEDVAPGRNKEGRRKWLLNRYGEQRKEPGLTLVAPEGTGNWVYVTYATGSERISQVEWKPGTVKLAFTYEDVTHPDTPARILALIRTLDFKWLSRVELKHTPTGKTLYQVDFDHDPNGNLLHAVRTQWQASESHPDTLWGPYPLWTYEYHPIPPGLTGPERWSSVNELKEARLIHSPTPVAPPPETGAWSVPTTPVQWWASYARTAAAPGKFKHMQPHEMVASVLMTGQQGQPLKIDYPSEKERTLTRPDGVKVELELNAYGSLKKKKLPITGTESQTDWYNDKSLAGLVTPQEQLSASGRKVAFQPNANLLPDNIKLSGVPKAPGTQPVPGVSSGSVLASFQYGSASKPGVPTSGVYPTANGSTTWSAPQTAEGSLQSLSIQDSIGERYILTDAWYDVRGRPQRVTDAQGRVVEFNAYDDSNLEQPKSMTLTLAAADPASALRAVTRTLTYDDYGRMVRVDDSPTGAWESWAYDGLGRLREHVRSGEPTEEWHYEYVEADKKLTVRESLELKREPGDPLSRRHQQETVIEDGLTTSEKYWVGSPRGANAITTVDGTAFSQVSRSYTYQKGRLDTSTDERGVVRKQIYDDNGRLLEVRIGGPSGKLEVSYELDAEGRVKSTTDHLKRTTTVGYDVLGRAVSWNYGDGDVDGVTLDAQGAVMYRWVGTSEDHKIELKDVSSDALGRRRHQKSVAAPGGVYVVETLNDAGQLRKREDLELGLVDEYEYKDVLGRVTTHTRKVMTEIAPGSTLLSLVWKEERKYKDAAHQIEVVRTIDTGTGSTRTESETQHVDSAGRVLRVERSFQGELSIDEYRYNERGQVRWHKSPRGGAITEYRCDPVGNLVQTIEPADDLPAPGQPLKTTSLLYEDGRVWTEKGPHPDSLVTYDYDEFGELKSKRLSEYTVGNLVTPATTWTYEPTANVGEVKETAPEGVETLRRFNARGKLMREEVRGTGGARQTVLTYEGPWERSREAREGTWVSRFETQVRDDRGRPRVEVESWSGEGASYRYTTNTTWTGRSAVVTEVWATKGTTPSSDDAQRNREMTLSVDSLGNLVMRKQGTHTDRWLYDAAGKLARLEPAGRLPTLLTYEQGLLVSEDYGDEHTNYTYYLDGRLKSRTEPGTLELGGRTRTYDYYPRGVLKSEEYGRGGEVQRTEYAYDPASGLLAKVSQGAQASPENGRKDWTYVHGARGELLSVSQPDELGTFTYTYDGLLRLKTVDAAPVKPGMAKQDFEYDFAGRITRRRRGGGGGPYWQTTYANGAATSIPVVAMPRPEDPPEPVAKMVTLLDGRGRVARTTYTPTSAGSEFQDLTQVSYEYNGADQPLNVAELRRDATVTNAFGYDSRGLLSSVVRGADAVTYGYTASGQRERVKVDDGAGTTRSVHYIYDVKNRLHRIDRTPSDAARGQTAVEWEPGGERLTLISDGALVQRRCHDSTGRIKTVINAPPGATVDCNAPFANALAAYTYTYDARGNRLAEETRGSDIEVPGVTRYGYDGADRLTGVRYPQSPEDRTVLYSLGTDGTRLGEKELTGYVGELGPEAYASATGTRHWEYGYDSYGGLRNILDKKTNESVALIVTDPFGRVRSDERALVKTDYRWDSAGRIAQIEVSHRASEEGSFGLPSTTARYAYDYAGLRRTKSVGTDVSSWLYVGEELTEERLPLSLGSKLMLERAGGLVTAVGGERILHDGMGSAVGRVNAPGATTTPKLYRFNAWGEYNGGVRPESNEASIGYTGHSWDSDAGLVYAQQRWYSPMLGRMLSLDPVIGEPANPLSFHGFIYALANPLRYVDPDGRRDATPEELAKFILYSDLADKEYEKFGRRWVIYQMKQSLMPGTGDVGRARILEAHIREMKAAIARADDGEPISVSVGGEPWKTSFETSDGKSIEMYDFPVYRTGREAMRDGALANLSMLAFSPVSAAGYVIADTAGASEETKTAIIQTGGAVWNGVLLLGSIPQQRAAYQSAVAQQIGPQPETASGAPLEFVSRPANILTPSSVPPGTWRPYVFAEPVIKTPITLPPAIRNARDMPKGGNGRVLRDGEGATPAEIAASRGGPTGGTRGQDQVDARDRELRAARERHVGPGPVEYECWRCGHKSTNPSDMHLGHRNVPTSLGGNLEPVNTCLEGAACNLSANNRGGPSSGMSCVARGSCGAPYGR
jgi:RHS repeat-associated protein